METENKIKELEDELEKTIHELNETKEHLKKYTAPISRRIYYEKNKEKEKQRAKEYKQKTNYKPTPEQKKEYNKQSYLRQKEKHKQEIEEKPENKNV
jgi:hypothetical protein